MTSGKKKTVFFYEPFFKGADGKTAPVPQGFWDAFMDRLAGMDADKRRTDISFSEYRGSTRTDVLSSQRYIYIGKSRAKQDWPDHSLAADDEQPLSVDGVLVEPNYVLPLSGSRYVATMRTSGGPTYSATVTWLDRMLDRIGHKMEFNLRAVVHPDRLKELSDSYGVSRLDIKVEAGGSIPDDAGEVGTAIQSLQAASGVDMSVGVNMSFGHAKADRKSAKKLAGNVEKLLNESQGISRLEATILKRVSGSEKSKPEKVNFIHDKIVHRVVVGESTGEAFTASAAISAMSEAIQEFRQTLGSILDLTADNQNGNPNEDSGNIPGPP